MNVREISKDWIIEREKIIFERYCSICGAPFTSRSPTASACSELCSKKMANDLNKEVYGIFLEAVPQALGILGFDSVGDYFDSKNENKGENNDGFVYFIQSGNAVKIGYAKDVNKRIKSLQTGNQERLNLLLYIPGNLKKESEIHGMFDDYRLTGEWFSYSEELRDFIDSNKKTIDAP